MKDRTRVQINRCWTYWATWRYRLFIKRYYKYRRRNWKAWNRWYRWWHRWMWHQHNLYMYKFYRLPVKTKWDVGMWWWWSHWAHKQYHRFQHWVRRVKYYRLNRHGAHWDIRWQLWMMHQFLHFFNGYRHNYHMRRRMLT